MGDTWETRAELAGREGLALLFLAEEGWETHGSPELSWRVGRGWPFFSFFFKIKTIIKIKLPKLRDIPTL